MSYVIWPDFLAFKAARPGPWFQREIRWWAGKQSSKTTYSTGKPAPLHDIVFEDIWWAKPVYPLKNGYGKSEWALCRTPSPKWWYLSQGVLPLPPILASAWDRPAKPSRLQSPNTELSIATPLASFPTYLPSIFSPPRSFGGMEPLSGRWADGDRQCPPAPKANWERPEKDCGAAEWYWHDGKINAGPSSAFAYSQGSTANVLPARSH